MGLRTLLIVSAWFGLVTGLVEGVGLFAVRQLSEYNWNFSMMDVGPQCLWISPLVDVVLFCAVGLVLHFLLSRRKWPTLPAVIIFAFTSLMVLNWLGILLGKRVAPYAIVLLAAGVAACCTRVLIRRLDAVIAAWRRSLPYVAGTVVGVLAVTQTTLWWLERSATKQLAPKAGLPNVVVIVADTLRADRLSCYGYERNTSPNIDRFADEGTLFSAAFSTSSWTAPSHASMLTGMYPSEHGVEWQTFFALLQNEVPVLPEVLRDHGYRTGAFSANIFWFTRPMGFGRGFIHFEDYYHSVWDMVLRTVYGRLFKRLVLPRLGFEDIPARKSAANINKAFLAWVDRHPKHPFFAFLNYMDTHDPYLPPEPFRSRFSESHSPGGLINDAVLHRNHPNLTPKQLQSESDAYDGAVAYLDAQVGALLRGLETRGLTDSTLVIFTSDHGESFGEHGLLLHGNSLYRNQIHVPLIIRLPGCIAGGVRVDRVVSNAAIPATVMDVIGLNAANVFPCDSLIGRQGGAPTAGTAYPTIGPFAIAELKRQPWAPEAWPVHGSSMRAIVTETCHLIQPDTEAEELYRWRDDLAESNNLIFEGPLQPVLRTMREVLRQTGGWHRAPRSPDGLPSAPVNGD